MKSKFFILCTSVMLLTSGFTANALAKEKIVSNTCTDVCAANEEAVPYLACCMYPNHVYVSDTTVVCTYCGRVIKW